MLVLLVYGSLFLLFFTRLGYKIFLLKKPFRIISFCNQNFFFICPFMIPFVTHSIVKNSLSRYLNDLMIILMSSFSYSLYRPSQYFPPLITKSYSSKLWNYTCNNGFHLIYLKRVLPSSILKEKVVRKR